MLMRRPQDQQQQSAAIAAREPIQTASWRWYLNIDDNADPGVKGAHTSPVLQRFLRSRKGGAGATTGAGNGGENNANEAGVLPLPPFLAALQNTGKIRHRSTNLWLGVGSAGDGGSAGDDGESISGREGDKDGDTPHGDTSNANTSMRTARGVRTVSQHVSQLHMDPHDNLYALLKGEKVFVLVSPELGSRLLPTLRPQQVQLAGEGGKATGAATDGSALFSMLSASWRLLSPMLLDSNASDASAASSASNASSGTCHEATDREYWSGIGLQQAASEGHVFVVRVAAGQALYLPAGWFHMVASQSKGGGIGLHMAVNIWFDLV
jgi:hypothetical protein